MERQQRQNNTFLVLIAMVLVIGFIALGNWMQWWTIGGRRADATPLVCPDQTVSAPDLTKVNVYNGTDRRGLAAAVAKELQRRSFQVIDISTRAQAKPLKAVVVIRHGAAGAREAHTVALQFPGKIQLLQDDRDNRTVDVVIGEKYKSMVDRKKAAAAIEPKADPAGCVEPQPTVS